MAQREDFEVKSGARPHDTAERHQNRDQQGCHRKESLALAADNFNSGNTYGVFRRHTMPAYLTITSRTSVQTRNSSDNRSLRHCCGDPINSSSAHLLVISFLENS